MNGSAIARRDRQRYNISPMLTQSSVYWALGNRNYTADPEYVKAVIRSYVYFKKERQKSKFEISLKLELLERDFPQFGSSFRAIREEYSLPASRILPALRIASTPSSGFSTNSNTNSLRRTQTSTAPSRVATTPITRTHTTAGATTVRPAPPQNDGDEPPPPPYTSQDPEPEATRTLQERLAAEAEAAGAGALTNEPIRTPSTNAGTRTNQRPLSTPNPLPSSDYMASASPPASAHANQPTTSAPDAPPTDPEMARAWEESQFEEAKRASMAAAREQEELQEAMRLSLAEAEANGQGVFHSTSSEFNEAGPSYQPMMTVPEVEHGEAGPSTSATTTTGSSSGGGNSSGYADMKDLLSGMDDLTLPEGGQAPLTPQKTGHHLRSKNPFLSSMEREQLQEEEAGHSAPPGSARNYSSANDSPRASTSIQNLASPLETPGSSYTQYIPPNGPPLPTKGDPNNQSFSPPPGPPPAHLRIVTPPLPVSPTARPLPATPRDQTSWADTLSPQSQSFQPMSTPPPQPAMSSPLAYSSPAPRQPSLGSAPDLPPRRRSSFVPPKGKEDALEMLREFDTVFLVDDSTSMAEERWSQARLALMEVAEIAARYDENGVDIYFLNSKRVGKELKAAHEVEDLFRGLEPKGATPTGIRLESILRDYMSRLERSQLASPGGSHSQAVKAMNLIVVTDGAPTDDPESVIVACAKRLDRGEFPLSQVGIQFLQIGDDIEAREALQELDDGISSTHGVRDMVDTVLYNGEDISAGLIIKALLGGINRRLDRRSSA